MQRGTVYLSTATWVNVLLCSPALLSVLCVVEMGHCGAVSCLLAVQNAVQVCRRLKSREAAGSRSRLNPKHTSCLRRIHLHLHIQTVTGVTGCVLARVDHHRHINWRANQLGCLYPHRWGKKEAYGKCGLNLMKPHHKHWQATSCLLLLYHMITGSQSEALRGLPQANEHLHIST